MNTPRVFQARLGQLRQRLSKLSQIDVSQIPSDKVGLGSQVVVQDEFKATPEDAHLLEVNEAGTVDYACTMRWS